MKLEFHRNTLGSILGFTDDIKSHIDSFSITANTIKFLWNRNDLPVVLSVDGVEIRLQPNQMVTITYLNYLSLEESDLPITALLFNREFYCISDHDSEVSCNGILFFGNQDVPVITIKEKNRRNFELLHEILIEEFSTPDSIQGDMLQMLLKRFIIMATRLAKDQLKVKKLNNDQIDLIRKFNYLVDKHYKTKRKVSEYAEMLFKSPKTLSNVFAIYNQKTPQQIIQGRLILEAKRLILYTDKQNKEIAFELGFNDPGHFSRFFKKLTQHTPSEFRESLLLKS